MDLVADSTRKILGKLDPKHFLPIYPHFSASCPNLNKHASNIKTEECISLYSQFSYSVSHPLPVNKPSGTSRSMINGMDPGLSLVREKRLWEQNKKDILKYCLNNQVKLIKDTDLESSDAFTVPFSVVLLADHFSKDPDEHLNNNYNVYFTGGNISSLNVASENYLIFPKKNNGHVSLCMLKPESDFQIESSTSSNDTVFQVESSGDFIIARQKERICLFSIQERDSKLHIVNKLSEENDIPYFSVALHKELFCTTAANRQLDLFDIAAEKVTLSGIVDPEEKVCVSDKWSSAYFVDDNTLCFIHRSCIGFVDLRCKTTLAEKWLLSKVTEDCEEAFSGAKGCGGIQYITTSHQLLSLDPRAGFFQRFTHGITHSPAFIYLPPNSLGTDRIFIGSQVSDSVVFIENNFVEGNCVGSSHPYLLPNLADTFHMARYNGYFLDNAVSSRFSMCMTGLTVTEDEEGMHLFRLTSAGDIFKQSLFKSFNNGKDLELTEDDFEKLAEWEDECIKLSTEQIESCTAAAIQKDNHIINYIKSDNEEHVEPVEKIDFSEVPWRISKKELLSYCDYLAPKILEEWGLDDIEEWATEEFIDNEIKTEPIPLSSDEDVTEKVAKWMEKYKEEDDTEYYYFPDPSQDEIISVNPNRPEEENLPDPTPAVDDKQQLGILASTMHAAGF